MTAILRWLFDILARLLRTLDWPLCVALLALMTIGLAVLYSAGNESPRLVMAQGVRYGFGFVATYTIGVMLRRRLGGVRDNPHIATNPNP